ncbi:RsmD family RNA methyltransferase [Rhodopila sp.]|uniref:RsmD family RNA methyltransferase n=1 Tax=Rhodopila sp. TaxID=2480087 RepID=UPI002BDD8907|nr:RsmD family RNA methyltransferase [Rhodopila sp.]HVZ09975.1 RsmD family RNA methyltransferase [Rhodopila sp.]
MRIVAGAWRGRTLAAPRGQTTRPTADRLRQALFDMLLHAPWGGRAVIDGAIVVDAFAGTGAMGLEALSRGAARCYFIESDPAALRVLRSNIALCRAGDRGVVVAGDVLSVGRGEAATLAFLDPPYGQGLVPRAVTHLLHVGRLAADALLVAETGREEDWRPNGVLAERTYGAARVVVCRVAK